MVANMKGGSPEEVAARVLGCPGLHGLQGPTVSPVFTRSGGEPCFAATICVPKRRLYACVKELRSVRAPVAHGMAATVLLP